MLTFPYSDWTRCELSRRGWLLLAAVFSAVSMPAFADTHPAVTYLDEGIEERLAEARRELAAGRFDVGARIYVDLREQLARRRARDPERRLVVRVSESRDLGAELVLRQRIESLPKPAKEAYRRVIGPRAQAQLDALGGRLDVAGLGRVAARYAMTEAGAEASRRCADALLESGEVSGAARAFARLARVTEGEESRAHRARAARCYELLGDSEGLRALGGEAATDTSPGPLRASSAQRLPRIGAFEDRVSFRDSELDRDLEARSPRLESYQEPVLSDDGRHVILADSKTVRCYDVSGRPKRLWAFTVKSPDAEPERVEVLYGRAAVGPELVFATLNRNRPASWRRRQAAPADAEDAQGDQGSKTEGEQPGAEPDDEGEEDDMATVRRKRRESKDPDRDFEVARPLNWRVVALDRSSGKLRWDLADRPEFERFSRGAEWVSAPTLADGALFVTVLLRGNELRSLLLKISADDGRVSWIADIASRSPENHRGLMATMVPPKVVDGRVLVATGIGLIAALDADQGSLLWAQRYPVFPERSQPSLVDERERFHVSPMAILRGAGLVVVAPTDGPYLFALHLSDGRFAWRRPRGDGRYVSSDGEELAIAGRGLDLIDARSGLARAQVDALTSAPRCRPLLGAESVLVLTEDAIVRLRRSDLMVESRFTLDASTAGSGLSRMSDDRLLLVGPRDLKTFAGVERVAGRHAMLSGVERLRVEASALLQRGERARAVDRLREALEQSSENRRVRLAVLGEIGDALLDRAKSLWVGGERAAALPLLDEGFGFLADERELAVLLGVRDPERRSRAARQRSAFADRLFESGEARFAAPAMLLYQGLLDIPETFVLEHSARVPVNSRSYAEHRQRALLAAHGLEAHEPIQQRASKLIGDVLANGPTTSSLAELLGRYPLSREAPELHLELARLYQRRFRHGAVCETLERFLAEFPGDPREAEALALLAEAYSRRKQDLSARAVLERLATEHPEARVPAGGSGRVSGRMLAERLGARLRRVTEPSAVAAQARAQGLQAPLRRAFRTETDLEGGRTRLATVLGEEARSQFFLLRGGGLEARVADGGMLSWRREDLGELEADDPLYASGPLLIVPQRDGVVALERATGELRWRFGAPGEARGREMLGLACDRGRVVVLCADRRVYGLEATTGREVWKVVAERRVRPGLVARDGRVALALEWPAGLRLVSLEDGAELHALELDAGSASGHACTPVLSAELAVCAVSDDRLVAVELSTGRVRYRVRVEEVSKVQQLRLSHDEATVIAAGGGFAQRLESFAVLDASSGERSWSDDGRGRVGGFGRASSTALIQRVALGSDCLYTVRRRSMAANEVWCQELATGKRRWRWAAPRGQGPQSLIETAGHLLVAYGGDQAGGSLSVLGKGDGISAEIHRFPGQRVVGVEVVAGTLLVLSERGQFAFGHFDDRSLDRDVVEIAEELAGDEKHRTVLSALLADRLQKSGLLRPAIGLIERALLAEGLAKPAHDRLYAQLVALRELQVELGAPLMRVRRLGAPAEIDGELNDWWRDWSSVPLSGPGHVQPIQVSGGRRRGSWQGQEDLSAKLYMAYDERNFYFALDVRDQELRPYDSEADDWIGDCLLMAIDCKNDGGLFYASDDLLLSLALTRPKKKKDKKGKKDPKDDEQEDDDDPEGKYFVKRKEDGSGAVYECKIPWAVLEKHGAKINLDAGPRKGFTFGFNVVLTDDDGERGSEGQPRGALKALSWTPSLRLNTKKSRLWQGYLPEYFGKVVLD